MKLLLDTHIAVWAIERPERLSEPGKELLIDAGNSVFVSAASIWEISIKNPLSKREDGFSFSAQEAIGRFLTSGFALLDITPKHAATVETLPLIHRDPFDRLLVAQALSEPMRLMTADPVVAQYSDTVIFLK